jgi:hypothetical protein
MEKIPGLLIDIKKPAPIGMRGQAFYLYDLNKVSPFLRNDETLQLFLLSSLVSDEPSVY